MFVTACESTEGGGAGAAAVAPDGVTAARELLLACSPAAGSAEMIEQIRALEELRGVLAAAQASVSVAFEAARRAEQLAAGLPKRRLGLGIGQELAAARRVSPSRASRDLGLAKMLTTELPHTYAALRAGATSEYRAMLIAKETGWLTREDRTTVDAQLGPRLGALGDHEVEQAARRLAYALDPHGLVQRFARAARGRRVSIRPEPEGMTRLSALLPLTQGVAAYAALRSAADSARAAGDPRSHGAVMADTLIERVTGQATADGVPLHVDVIITDQALFRSGPGAETAAEVSGYGPIPANVARDLITRTTTGTVDTGADADFHTWTATAPPTAPWDSPTTRDAPTEADTTAAATTTPAAPATGPASTAGTAGGVPVWLRRLYTDPAGRLVSMETKGRFFTPAMAEYIRLRDLCCTTPYCGAPIRHIDHRLPWHLGGTTSLTNGDGTCACCNFSKEAPGWTLTIQPDGTTRLITPTGHDQRTFTRIKPPGAPSETATSTSTSPPPPGHARPPVPPDKAAPLEAMPPEAMPPEAMPPAVRAVTSRRRKPPRQRRRPRKFLAPLPTDG